MGATPLSCVFSCMTVKNSEESLPSYTSIVDHKGMGIFHISARTHILRYANLIGTISSGVLIQDTKGVDAIGSRN
jgi:hypothetical protein